jgi:hypothetical protein
MRKATRLLVFVAVVALAGCGGEGSVPAHPDGRVGLQPPPAPPGWSISEGPTSYDSETLFEYLNGGAPLYLEYGFKSLHQIRYQLGDDPYASVTLDVYDMGSELGAFGVYRSILPPRPEIMEWGAEGYRSGTVAAAWKGTFYVHAEADDDRPELVEGLDHVMSLAVAAIQGSVALPSILEVFPRDGLREGSERYVAADLFGHAFLPGGFVAGYENDSGEAELFFSEMGSAVEAEEALALLRAHEEQWGEVGADIDGFGEGGFRFTDPGLGPGLAVRSGTYVVGVHGDGSGDALVRELLTRLPLENDPE